MISSLEANAILDALQEEVGNPNGLVFFLIAIESGKDNPLACFATRAKGDWPVVLRAIADRYEARLLEEQTRSSASS